MDKSKWFTGSISTVDKPYLKRISHVNDRLRKYGIFINKRSLAYSKLPYNPKDDLDMTAEVMFFDVNKTQEHGNTRFDESLLIATDGLAIYGYGTSASLLKELVCKIVEEMEREGMKVKKGMQIGTIDYEDGDIRILNLSIAFTIQEDNHGI